MSRPQVLHDHVGLGRAIVAQPLPVRIVLQIDRDRLLLRIEILEGRRRAVGKHVAPLARIITAVRALDLDHFRTERTEHPCGIGGCNARPDFDDAHAFERLFCC